MKFVHIADMHFDSPFVNLSDIENLGEKRRLEQRKVFKKIINYIMENDIELLFISGDLYEQKYIKKSTIEYINNLFKEIPNTKIFISPGNHDPFIKNSYYNKYKWSDNVKIFNSKIEKVELENINIYGFGFSDFYCKDCGIDDIVVEDKDKLNILVIHGSLDSGNVEDKEYNPLSKKKLEMKDFDYVALGHIHKSNYNISDNNKIIYPGSTVSLGFDELGKHGMIVGEIKTGNIDLKFVPVDEREFKIFELNVTEFLYKEELIERINELIFEENELIEIYLIGRRNFEINIYELYKLILNEKIIKIKDNTEINFNLNDLKNDFSLKGLFIKEMLEKLDAEDLTDRDRRIIEKAIEIGLNALD